MSQRVSLRVRHTGKGRYEIVNVPTGAMRKLDSVISIGEERIFEVILPDRRKE